MTRFALCVLLALGSAWAADEPASVSGSTARIFFLDIRGGRVVSANPDGSDLKVLVDGHKKGPDGMDPQKGFDPKARKDQEILTGDLKEAIGIALDLKGGRMFFTDLGGTVYSANLNGSDKKVPAVRAGQRYRDRVRGIEQVDPRRTAPITNFATQFKDSAVLPRVMRYSRNDRWNQGVGCGKCPTSFALLEAEERWLERATQLIG